MGLLAALFLLGVLCHTEAQTDITSLTEHYAERQIYNLETELSKLRRLHNQGKDKLREMERKIIHFQTGLGLLCTTLRKHTDGYKPLPPVEAPTKSIQPTVSGITADSVQTIVSPVGDTLVVQISVRFSTTETHEVIWAYNLLEHMIPVRDGDPFSSTRTEKENERFTTHLYFDANHLSTIELLYLKILSEFSEITILFDKHRLLQERRIKLSAVKLWNEKPSPEVLVLKPEVNATIVTNIDTTVQKLTTYVNFIGIDDSNKLLDIRLDDDRIGSNMQNTTKGFKWSVSLDPFLVSMGGLVSLRAVEKHQNGPILQIHVGKTIYIIPDIPGALKVPFPPHSLGVLPLYKVTQQTVVTRGPIAAIWCYAFGNPAPITNIVKYKLGGEKKFLEGHTYHIGQYDSAHVVILRNVSITDEGQYTCEARTGRKLAIEPVTVYVT